MSRPAARRAACLLLAAAFAPGCVRGPRPPGFEAEGAAAWAALLKRARSEGTRDVLPAELGHFLLLPPRQPVARLLVGPGESDDRLAHAFNVGLKGRKAKPVAVVLQTSYEWPGNYESRYYRLSLEGRLEKAITLRGRLDADGRRVSGSGLLLRRESVGSPDVARALRHELDFWLRGRHRKPAPGAGP